MARPASVGSIRPLKAKSASHLQYSWEVAHALRLPLDGAFLVVAAQTQLGHDPLPRAESRLAVLDVNSVWRLEADQSLGVLSLPNRARIDAVLDILGRALKDPSDVAELVTAARAWAQLPHSEQN